MEGSLRSQLCERPVARGNATRQNVQNPELRKIFLGHHIVLPN
jgi:hypothetical protein